MTTPAHVGSTAEIERFREHLVEYRRVLYRTVELLQVEIHRVLEWVERDRRPYWLQQKKLSEVRLAEAEATYSRCMSRTRADQERSCFSEKKIVERWRQRVAEVDEHLRRLRDWQRELHREAEAFQMQVRRLGVMAEDDVARAIVALDRIQRYLQKYLRLVVPPSSPRAMTLGASLPNQVSSTPSDGAS